MTCDANCMIAEYSSSKKLARWAPQQLAAVSERLRRGADVDSSFGGVGVAFSGDFARRPSIGRRSLIYKTAPGKSDGRGESSADARLGDAGRWRFDEASARIRLQVVYRQGRPSPAKNPLCGCGAFRWL